MSRIINTSAFGWMDMDHVLRVTPVKWEPNPKGFGGFMQFHVFVMMRDKPFTWQGEWDRNDMGPTQEQREEANEAVKNFLLAWRDGK